ncbi:hypothetical protein [Arenimonas composti]|uniref:Uncharacterized protein n=1 Tax=Arenimonas composti TR7-09 = DSM 18010 TaxID=1121013 RepID=A0A091B7U4_9GAMM|nr:hypothetical protein [Arenimonas composti]KFN48738.1 hypothetical protein P873_13860 [Arenimonas composti TR7-09 = DSM 18010]
MKNRHVYVLPSAAMLETALEVARRVGVDDADLAVVARHDIELQLDPEPLMQETSRLSGVLNGLSAVTVPTLGVSVAGAGLLAQLGDNLANWFPALAGHDEADVRRAYHDRVEAGQILLVIDAGQELWNAVVAALTVEVGGEALA